MSKFFKNNEDNEDMEDIEQQEVQQQTKKDKKKKKSKFQVQEDEEDIDNQEQDQEQQQQEEEQEKPKKSKKKSKFQVAEDEENNGEDDNGEEQEEKQTKKKKNKSKFQVEEEDNEQQQEEEEEQAQKKDKKKKKQSKFAVAEDEEEQLQDEEQQVEEEEQIQKKDKKKKKQSKFATVEDDEEQQQQEEELEQQDSKKDKKKKKSKFDVQEDEKSEEEVKHKKKSKKDKKKSKFQQDDEDEDIKVEVKEAEVKTLSKEEKKKLQEQQQKEEEARLLEELKQQAQQNKEQEPEQKDEEQKEEEGKPQEKTKAQLKREKKKLKEKMAKEGGDQGQQQEETENKEEPTESKNKKKKKAGKVNIAAQRAAEALEKKLKEEKEYQDKLEAAKRAEEERIRKLEEEEAEKKRLKEEEIAKLKKEGKFKTRKQIREEEELARARARLQLIKPAATTTTTGGNKKPAFVQKKLSPEELKKQREEEEKAKKLKQQQEEEEKKKKEEEAQEDVLEDWEMMSDDEDNNEEQKQGEEKKGGKKPKKSSLDEKENSGSAKFVYGKKKKKSSGEIIEENKEALYQQPSNLQQQKPGEVYRSPIICIMGHVDTGKTTLLDKLRHTNVQGNEAGGITQQIGATYFPGDKITEQIVKCEKHYKTEIKAPGLLVIDTPGHESFANLRSRGSGLCDFAILVIDLMHGLEQQTMESLKLLTMRKTPYVIALNKIDRCYDWKPKPYESSFVTFKKQNKSAKNDFDTRLQKVITQLAETERNVKLYWDIKSKEDIQSYFPIVPTSGITGEGIPDLLSVIIKYTSFFMKSKMMVKEDEFNCTVMEVKVIEGHGATIDCILVDGVLRKGDTITILGFKGPITTKIRALLTPHPMKEMRVKGEYINHDIIYASMGLKIAAKGLEEAVAGSQLLLSNTPEDQEEAEEIVGRDLASVKKKIKLSNHGVGVAASTLGSLEALLSFLKDQKIPVSYVTIGPVSRDDITKAMKALLADDPQNRKKEFATMLVFDVKVLKEAQEYAENQGVKIFTAQIIYHLQDDYIKYKQQCLEERRQQHIKDSIFPCQLKVLKVFRANKPMLVGVKVDRGQLRIGTPLVAYVDQIPQIGIVDSIESNGKPVKNGIAKKETGDVAIKINEYGNAKGGQTFTEDDILLSKVSRHSIDCLKEHFKDEVSKDEWKFIRDKLKPLFDIY